MESYEKHVEKNSQKRYACDICCESFYLTEVILTDPHDRITTILPDGKSEYLFINKKGIPVGGYKPPLSENGDKVLTCPKCKAQHLFGFQFAAGTIVNVGTTLH
jgi:hypothetical protein